MTGGTILGQRRIAEFLCILSMAAHARIHGVLHRDFEHVGRFYSSVANDAAYISGGVPPVAEIHPGFRLKLVQPRPWNLLFTVKEGLRFENLRAVGFDDRVAAHAETYPGQSSLAVFFRA